MQKWQNKQSISKESNPRNYELELFDYWNTIKDFYPIRQQVGPIPVAEFALLQLRIYERSLYREMLDPKNVSSLPHKHSKWCLCIVLYALCEAELKENSWNRPRIFEQLCMASSTLNQELEAQPILDAKLENKPCNNADLISATSDYTLALQVCLKQQMLALSEEYSEEYKKKIPERLKMFGSNRLQKCIYSLNQAISSMSHISGLQTSNTMLWIAQNEFKGTLPMMHQRSKPLNKKLEQSELLEQRQKQKFNIIKLLIPQRNEAIQTFNMFYLCSAGNTRLNNIKEELINRCKNAFKCLQEIGVLSTSIGEQKAIIFHSPTSVPTSANNIQPSITANAEGTDLFNKPQVT